AIARQSDGKIVVATYWCGQFISVVLERFRPDGTVDMHFGFDGVAMFRADSGFCPTEVMLAIDSKDRAVIGDLQGEQDLVLTRVLPDGQLDESFGRNGTVYYGYAGDTWGTSLAVDSKNRVVVAGPALGCGVPGAARLTVRGAIDSSFGRNGCRAVRF